MSGLMTRNRMSTIPPKPIPPSLMIVVQNILSYAWKELLSEVKDGNFEICGTHEDEITERLCMILGDIKGSEIEEVKGFSMFETPVREGNMRNWRGDRLDCQPDITFRPLKDYMPTPNPFVAAIFVECKPIDSKHPIPSAYCNEGISRFVRGDYAWAVDRAMMLAYVRNICNLPAGLSKAIETDQSRKKYQLENSLSEAGKTITDDYVFHSVHQRVLNPPPAIGTFPPITLHHLWLYPELPCETTRCRT